jgi:hypothetical protein
MCSIAGAPARAGGGAGGQGALDRLGAAIEELAAAQDQDGASGGAAGPEVAARLAGLWAMVAELDPELARRLGGYGG